MSAELVSPKRIAAFGAALAVLVIAGIAGWRAYSDYRVRVLYSGFYSYQGDPSQQVEIVKKLAVYRSRESSEKLLAIAMGELGRRGMVAWPQVRVQAIKSLHGRTETGLDADIARVIQPYEPLVVRRAAADELLSRNCDRLCMDQLLHYLERELNGETSPENRLTGGADYIAADKADLHKTLVQIIRNNESIAFVELRDIYGLGSWDPSIFAIVLIRELRANTACPFLMTSVALQAQYGVTNPPLDRAVEDCKCKN